MADQQYDPEIWVRKDKLNSRMSALKAASVVLEGSELSAEILLERAEKMYLWLIQDQEFATKPEFFNVNEIKDESSLPTPTLQQKEWLDKITTKYGYTEQQVFEALGSYPANNTQAVKVVKKLKENENGKEE